MWLLVLNEWDRPEHGSVVKAVIDIDDIGNYDGSGLEMALSYGSTECSSSPNAQLLFPQLPAMNLEVLE